MKRPRPTAPAGVPEGTVALSREIEWFRASLQVSAVGLIPGDVTRLLGCAPTESWTKDVPLLRGDGTVRRVPRFGRWSKSLEPTETDEWDVTEVVRALFDGLTDTPEAWAAVAKIGDIRVFLGLSLPTSNAGFVFDVELIQFLAKKSASIWFDVYHESSDDASA